MYKIYLDTSTRGENKITLYKKTDVLETIQGDVDVVASIKTLLEKHHVNIKEVDFDYFAGPGSSFTGLKVGAAVTNTLNFLNGKITSTQSKLPDYGREPNITPPKRRE
jgi:tRNA A37 threonylcarbamoyladenosine modification protein TsaB